MLAELKALIAIAETGSMERAAHDLSLTPSALTRRMQRLEVELGVVLLDRRFKPPKLTQSGFEVLDKSRAILSSLSDLKSAMSADAPPMGQFRLGLSHAVAQPDISPVIVDLTRDFPLLQPSLSNDVSCHLLTRLRHGELDGAIVVIPEATGLPSDLEGATLASEDVRPIEARTSVRRKLRSDSAFYRRNWILNPAGCLVREEIEKRVERLGVSLRIAAELHNPTLQLALIAGNVGVGVLRSSFLKTHPLRSQLRVIEDPGFRIPVKVLFLRGRYLGTRERVALKLQGMLVQHFRHSPV